MVSISYCITTHNEGAIYLENLFQMILKYIQPEDEIIVVDDFSNDSSTIDTLAKYASSLTVYENALNNDFSAQKNFAKSKCTKDYIVFIDADEVPCDTLMLTMKEILFNNPQVDMYLVPRINMVQGLTQADINRWDWQVNEKGWVNYPDYQTRIIKNIPEILWEGVIHERLSGFSTHSELPSESSDYCLIHLKEINRQRKQNEFYNNIVKK